MAIQCKYCGTDLPKEDARFCNNCGMLVPSHPFSHQSLSALKSSSSVVQNPPSDEPQERPRRVLREQVAELSPARTKVEYAEQGDPAPTLEMPERKPDVPESLSAKSLPQEASAVVEDMPLEKLPDTPQPAIENDVVSAKVEEVPEQLSPSPASPTRQAGMKRRMRGPAQGSASAAVWPSPVTHVSVKESSTPARRANEQHEPSPLSTLSNNEAAPARATRVNVWEDEERREQADAEEIAIDDLPTRALTVPVEDMSKQAEGVSVEDVPTQVVGMQAVEDVPKQAEDISVEDLPTRSIPVSIEKPSRVQERPVEKVPNPFLSVPATQSAAQEQAVEDWRVRAQSASSAPANAPVPTAFQPGVVSDSSRQAESALATPPVRRSRRRWPIVVLILLIILVLGGAGTLGAMMMLSQQSGNNPVIQAQVSFSDPQLGLSLLYPNGWQKQVDAGKSTVHFYATNRIGEIDIMVTPSSGTVKQALQQQATKMGMSAIKTGATLPFAGTNWQQLQGTMKLSGANYTDMIVATVHGSQLFMIVQQGPQNNYADWEQEFFAPLRDSFKFL
jgi:hypothetical protein